MVGMAVTQQNVGNRALSIALAIIAMYAQCSLTTLVENLAGSYTGVMGLPLYETGALLQRFGYPL